MDPYSVTGHSGRYTKASEMSVLQLKELVTRLYNSDPLQMKHVVDDIIGELGVARVELARQDDALQSLTMDLVEAQREAVRLHDFVNVDILGREHRAQGLSKSTLSPITPVSPTPPTTGSLRGELHTPFNADLMQDRIVSTLSASPHALYRTLSDIVNVEQWAAVVGMFEHRHPGSCLTTLVISACPEAKMLLRDRGVVL